MKKKGIYIFGAGAHGQVFYEVLTGLGLQVLAFLDSSGARDSYNNCVVLRPEQVSAKDVEVYISLGISSARVKEELQGAGFGKVFDLRESFVQYPLLLKALKVHSLWYSEELSDMVNPAGIHALRGLLEDAKSRRVLDQIVAFRRSLAPDQYVRPDHHVQYFPDDIDVFSAMDAIRLVDAGAYCGDTIRSIMDVSVKNNLKIEYIASFEPDPENLKGLREEIWRRSQGGCKARFFLYPAAVWERSESLHFADNLATSSCIVPRDLDSDPADTILGLSIDDCLYAAAPNFIKMDVEGAEKEAIAGARETIVSHRPVLAICLYHRPGDLWQIPLLLKKMVPDYRMYLRVYGDMLLETVLYCLPPRR